MIPIYDVPDFMNEERIYSSVQKRELHVVCPALTGNRQSYAYRFLSDILSDEKIEWCCRQVNEKLDLGSTWPKRYVSLLPVPPYGKGQPNWEQIFRDMFQVHLEKDQSYSILVIIDKGAYPDPSVVISALEKVAASYDWPAGRKKPFLYTQVDA
jgi:hypothetical protein